MYPCYFGTDIDSSDKLIAFNHTIEETAQNHRRGLSGLSERRVRCRSLADDKLARAICNGCFDRQVSHVEPPNERRKEQI